MLTHSNANHTFTFANFNLNLTVFLFVIGGGRRGSSVTSGGSPGASPSASAVSAGSGASDGGSDGGDSTDNNNNNNNNNNSSSSNNNTATTASDLGLLQAVIAHRIASLRSPSQSNSTAPSQTSQSNSSALSQISQPIVTPPRKTRLLTSFSSPSSPSPSTRVVLTGDKNEKRRLLAQEQGLGQQLGKDPLAQRLEHVLGQPLGTEEMTLSPHEKDGNDVDKGGRHEYNSVRDGDDDKNDNDNQIGDDVNSRNDDYTLHQTGVKVWDRHDNAAIANDANDRIDVSPFPLLFDHQTLQKILETPTDWTLAHLAQVEVYIPQKKSQFVTTLFPTNTPTHQHTLVSLLPHPLSADSGCIIGLSRRSHTASRYIFF